MLEIQIMNKNEKILGNENLKVSLPKYNWSGLKSLKYLYISYCIFTGPITTLLVNLTQITYLILSGNNFIGSISTKSLQNLTQINYLDLSRNNFIGLIQALFGNLTKLTYLDLSSNSFSGEIQLSLLNFACFWLTHQTNNF